MSLRSKVFVKTEEDQSEKIASVAQLIFLVTIFIIYSASPKGFSKTNFEPVLIMFFAYAPILICRALLAWTKRLNNIAIYAFISLDVLVLTCLIWSFHIQYDQPATLSLRAPSYLYYFIFIAIRCLSYDYKKIIYVGCLSALLWVGMVALALSSSQLQITRSFSEYLLPNTVLVGVEVDKILSLLVVTGFLATAVYRKNILLSKFALKSIRELTMEKLIGRRSLLSFDIDKEELLPGRGIRRNAATMMVDLRGFSKLSYEITPQEIIGYLGEYQKIAAEVVFGFSGSIDKYLGDGILAHFGAVGDDKEYAKSALKAAEALKEALDYWRAPLVAKGLVIDFGVAVTVGEVIFGVIGHEDRMEITTIGESVNLSAKLEKHTKLLKCRILTTKKTFETAKAQGYEPKLKISEYPRSEVAGIPNALDLVGLT